MEETQTQEKPVETITVEKPIDPFALDETQLASLSPEQRASLDPILDGWKKKASEQIETTRKTVSEEAVKPYREKAEALDKLSQHPAFVEWWNEQTKRATGGQGVQPKPQQFATAEEWSQAIINASNGDASKLQEIQGRMFMTMATPFVQQSQQQMSELSTKLEMKELMENHSDWKELDGIGLDDKGQGTSLLEFCIDWAEKNRKPLEEGYQMARRWADGMASGAKAQAMGLVKDKKDSVTAGPSTSSGGPTVVYVNNFDELMRKSMEAELAGRKDVKFEIKKS